MPYNTGMADSTPLTNQLLIAMPALRDPNFARGVAFLTADEAGFVTGSTMSLNGGQHMY